MAKSSFGVSFHFGELIRTTVDGFYTVGIRKMTELKNTALRYFLAVPGYSLDSRDRADPPSTKISIVHYIAQRKNLWIMIK